MKMSSEKLFLLEIAVTELKITADLNSQSSDSNVDQQTVICFQFLQLKPFEICEQESNNSLSDSRTCFKKGKSCMFPLSVSSISEVADQDLKLKVSVFKQLANDTKIIPSKVPIGEADIDLADLVLSIAKSVLDAPDEVPVTKSLNTTVHLKNASGKVSGEVIVFIRLSCHGDQVISRFQLDCDKSFVVKSRTAETAYRCNEISVENGANLVPQTVARGCCDCKFNMPKPKRPLKNCECKSERPPLFNGATTAYPLSTQMPSATIPEIPSQRPRNLCACGVRLDSSKKIDAKNISAAEDRKLTGHDLNFDIEEYLNLKKMPVDAGGIAQAKEREGVPTTTECSPNENLAKVCDVSTQQVEPAVTTADNQIVPTSPPQPSARPNMEIGLDNTERGNSMVLYSLNPSYYVNFVPDLKGGTAVRISSRSDALPEASRDDTSDRYLVRLTSISKTTGKQNSMLLDLKTPRPPQPPAALSTSTQYSLEDIQPAGAAVAAAEDGGAAPAQGKAAGKKKGKGGKKK